MGFIRVLARSAFLSGDVQAESRDQDWTRLSALQPLIPSAALIASIIVRSSDGVRPDKGVSFAFLLPPSTSG